MGHAVSKDSFDWSYTEEPHASRRKEIMKAHPEIKETFGIDPVFKWVVTAQVLTQILVCYMLRDSDWLLIVLQAYFVGGTFNHSLTLAVHEISHNMAFGTQRPLANRLFGMFANLPMGIPMSVSFKKYHLEHHRHMEYLQPIIGEDVLDTDVPTELEARVFNTTIRKFFWLFLQPLFYAFRPMIIYHKALTDLEILNGLVQLVFDYFVYQYFGGKSLIYLALGMFVGLGVHPLSGHFISDHYVFNEGQETYSYYGPINLVTYNVGHHVEHHDFPFVCGTKLPMIRKVAPEFYAPLTSHESWIYMMYDFVVNPNMGLRSRMKRPTSEPPQYYGFGSNASCMLYQYVEGFLHYIGFSGLWITLSGSKKD